MLFVRELIITVVVFLLTGPRCIIGDSGCNGLTTTIDLRYPHNGTIYSPGYPNNYGENENCKWLIQAPPGQKVLIYFTKFDVEKGSYCGYDSVNIFDGPHISASLLSKSCGNSLPPAVYSSGRYMYMSFTSDGSVSGEGFVAHYRALKNSSGCPSIVPGASAGVIYSPNFPWNYPAGISCDWFITVPWPRKINLKFTRFNLRPSSGYGSCSDYVLVRDRNFRMIGKYCGSQIPSSITSYGTLRVQFFSDFSIKSYSGFMAIYDRTGLSFQTATPYPYRTPYPTRTPYPYWTTYTYHRTTYPYHWTTYPYHWTTYPPVYPPSAQSIYTCKPYSQTTLYVESSSSLSIASSPDIDGSHPTSSPRTKCTFKIDTTNGFILELSFKKMSIDGNSVCSVGYVKVRDGSSVTAPLLGTYCNDVNYHDVVTTKGNSIFVEYYAYYRMDSFKATVTSKNLKGTPVSVAGIVIPLVIAFVLFIIIFVIIKCTKIRRSSEPFGQSRANEDPLQPLPDEHVELPPTTHSLPSNSEVDRSFLRHPHPASTGIASSQPSVLNTELAPPPYIESFATQSVTDMSQGDGSAYV